MVIQITRIIVLESLQITDNQFMDRLIDWCWSAVVREVVWDLVVAVEATIGRVYDVLDVQRLVLHNTTPKVRP